MSLQFHPDQGCVLICDFTGFVPPEMVKRRPVVVVSPRFRARGGLCTVVPLSTTPPAPVQPWHLRITLQPPLPAPYDRPEMWAKADMLYTVSFKRLQLPFRGKDEHGNRLYDQRCLSPVLMKRLMKCVLAGLGVSVGR